MSRQNYRSSTSEGMNCWSCWTRFKPCTYGENKHASLAASTGDEADKMIDRVHNETKEARLFLSQSNGNESEGNNTSEIGTFESAHGKDGHLVDENKQLGRIRIPKLKADTPVKEENKSSTYETVQEHAQRSIALRTVPVILKQWERRLQFNCFLDEC